MIGAGLIAATPLHADATCSGNACGVVALSGDGCQWTNKGDKSVRLSLVTDGVSRLVTVLAPGEAYREPNKAFCVAASDGRFDASFATLAKLPPEGAPAPVVARPKPAATPMAAAAPASSPAPVAAATPSVALKPLPRPKPALVRIGPPLPRAKPEIQTASAPVAPPAVVAPSAAMTAPSATAAPVSSACVEACPPILFKVIDGCLWVLNLNPRAVAFEAEVGGRRTALSLEAADGAKADARAAAVAAGTVLKDDGALHMRLQDPFQSAGSGIPIYRVRLGSPGSCVKSREQITQFSATYVK